MANNLMKLEDVEKEIQSTKWIDGLSLYKSGVELQKFVSDVITSFTIGRNSDDLKNAMTTPTGRASVFYALTNAAESGLSLNPASGEARLATYWDKNAKSYTANLEIDKNGYLKLSTIKGCTVIADVVKENDIWEPSKTFEGDEYKFIPARKDRGAIDGVFCAIREQSGTVHLKYMTIDEIEEHRDKYGRRNKEGKLNAIWDRSFQEMALKTVVKLACKALNIGAESNDQTDIEHFAEPVYMPALEGEKLEDTPTEKLLEEINRRADDEKQERESETAPDGNARF